MGKVGEQLDVDFIVSAGDNFYDDGLVDEEDPLFDESFSEVYTATSLQKQWYSGKIISINLILHYRINVTYNYFARIIQVVYLFCSVGKS